MPTPVDIRPEGLEDWFFQTYRPVLIRYAAGGLGVVMIAHPPGSASFVTLKLQRDPSGQVLVSPNSRADAATLAKWTKERNGTG